MEYIAYIWQYDATSTWEDFSDSITATTQEEAERIARDMYPHALKIEVVKQPEPTTTTTKIDRSVLGDLEVLSHLKKLIND